MSKYYITFNNTTYDLNTLIDTSGSAITTLYTGFPTSTIPNCNFEKIVRDINYSENGTSLMNKCRAISKTTNFTVPSGISKISGILASGGGGGGGGGGTVNADTSNNNDSGAGGGGGGSGCIVVLKDYPVSPSDSFQITVGGAGNGALSGTEYANNGNAGGTTNFTKNTNTTLLSIGGGGGGYGGNNGGAQLVGNNNSGNFGVGGLGGTIITNNVTSYTSVYNGSQGVKGEDAEKGNPGKGGNGASGVDVNNQLANTGVYLTYNTTGATGNDQNANGVGTTGDSAVVASPTSFSAGGGAGSGSGQSRVGASAGGNGSGGFVILYLYF